jgi:hypothetical protein
VEAGRKADQAKPGVLGDTRSLSPIAEDGSTMKRRNYLAWILVIVLAIVGWRYHKLNQDFSRLCILTGPHDASMSKQDTERGLMARLCLRHGWTGEYIAASGDKQK